MRKIASPASRAAAALLLLVALLPLPTRPEDFTPAHFLPPGADLAAIVLALCLLPRGTRTFRILVVGILAALTLWRLADLGMVVAFRRSFNPILDLHLLRSGWELGAGTFGALPAAAAIAGAVLVFASVFAGLFSSLGGIPQLPALARRVCAAICLALLVLGPGATLPGEVVTHAKRLRTALAEEARFAADLRAPDIAAPDFAALRGRDVIVLFVESYGRAWLEGPPHRTAARSRLAAVDDRLRRAGFSVRSAWLASPTRGGQSWLAHAAVMSGLWTSSQGRYDAVIASDRSSLNRLFARAGWRSVAVMPAITRDWPAARWFGYDEIFAERALGYRGEAFDWVTMPDQYTLAALDRLARGRGPAMIEAALISSHAPWTPLPRILPWAKIGDGSVFDGTNRRGAPPKQVWSSPASIRAAWSRSLDYSMEVVARWIARSAGDALVVVLGDHQPAPLVAGAEASADVLIHVIARDPSLLARLPGRWSDGMLPDPGLPDRRMSDLRAMLAACFSTGGCSRAGAS